MLGYTPPAQCMLGYSPPPVDRQTPVKTLPFRNYCYLFCIFHELSMTLVTWFLSPLNHQKGHVSKWKWKYLDYFSEYDVSYPSLIVLRWISRYKPALLQISNRLKIYSKSIIWSVRRDINFINGNTDRVVIFIWFYSPWDYLSWLIKFRKVI